jgi:hypothetical protein
VNGIQGVLSRPQNRDYSLKNKIRLVEHILRQGARLRSQASQCVINGGLSGIVKLFLSKKSPFELKRDGVTAQWRRLHNEELHDLY